MKTSMQTFDRPSVGDRVGALCGTAYVLLILVGNQLSSGAGTDPHPSGAKDLAELSTAPGVTASIGFTLEFLGFVAFAFFLGWLVHALRAAGGAAAWLAGAAGVAGAVTLAVKIASIMPMAAGRIDHADLTPALARVLVDMNSAAFVVTLLTFGTFLAAVGASILASGYLGRVAGWTAVVLGFLGVALTLLTGVDPVDTNPMPFLGGLLWVLVTTVRLAWKGSRRSTVSLVEDRLAVRA